MTLARAWFRLAVIQPHASSRVMRCVTLKVALAALASARLRQPLRFAVPRETVSVTWQRCAQETLPRARQT